MDWLAEKTMDHLYSERDTAELESCKAKLQEASTAKGNIMKAIEAGIFTASTKGRLEELEQAERELAAKIRILEAEQTIDISKDDVLSWLETIRDGDVNDRGFQETMIDAFLIRA